MSTSALLSGFRFVAIVGVATMVAAFAIAPSGVGASDTAVGGTCCYANTISYQCPITKCGYFHNCMGTTGSGTCYNYTACTGEGCSPVQATDCIG